MSSHTDIARSCAVGPSDDELLSLGKLQFLASFCPAHRQMTSAMLGRIFYPALNSGCVRFFENAEGKTAAALIWARLDQEVSARLLKDRQPPTQAEWLGGQNLWFLDLIAPFGHGKSIARNIARTPPEEPFYFARLGPEGTVRKIVRGDGTVLRGRVTAWQGLQGRWS